MWLGVLHELYLVLMLLRVVFEDYIIRYIFGTCCSHILFFSLYSLSLEKRAKESREWERRLVVIAACMMKYDEILD